MDDLDTNRKCISANETSPYIVYNQCGFNEQNKNAFSGERANREEEEVEEEAKKKTEFYSSSSLCLHIQQTGIRIVSFTLPHKSLLCPCIRFHIRRSHG